MAVPSSNQQDSAALAQLRQLLEQTANVDDGSVEDTLRLLQSADQFASGVEGKLDALLSRLESLLETLESETPSTASPPTVPPTPQS